jgi:UPF0755 protein
VRKLFTLFFIGLLIAGGWLAYALLAPVSPGGEKFVMLKPGRGARQIAAELERAGVIRDRRAFLLLHYIRGRQNLKAGEYRFADAADARTVYDRVARGDIFFHTVTIPEGYNIFDIAAAFEGAGLATKDQFLSTAQQQTHLIRDLDPAATSLEGYLFPDTYRFTRTQSLTDMIGTMVRRFREEAQALGLTSNTRDLVTMASIVEKETAVAEERPLVAGLFYNRLRIGMPLQTDPTVIYAALVANKWDGVIHQSDLRFNHPYNTYVVRGMPPGPIANPGRSALEAALKPQQSDFLYFVSDANGKHRFARNIAEHEANVALYRRALAAQ